jgi:peptide/nickel transport system substrate-binding protein
MAGIGRFVAGTLAAWVIGAGLAAAEPQHGIAMYGEPLLPPDFVSLPYANPDAPKGGSITFAEAGGFDSLNPYIVKGRSPYGLRVHVFESLLGRNWGESFSLYGLLAESVEVGPNREWVEFTLRPEAKFSDGSPVTVDDVMWSMTTLAEKGTPSFGSSWAKVASAEITGERSVKFTFNTVDYELPLILGMRPILKRADWEGRAFDESSLDVPHGSGPYVVGEFEADRYITFTRNPDYWGKDLAFNRGTNNLDEIRYDFYADAAAVWQAFTAGEADVFREGNPTKWDSEYNFPAVTSGAVVKAVVPHQRPSGMEGFVFNTRRPLFQDWRVREALIQSFNFEFVNQTINAGAYPRRTSFFANSILAMDHAAASGKVLDLLKPFEAELVPGALDAYDLPVSDGTDRNRTNMRRASDLLAEAGWTLQDGILKNAAGEAFAFEFMLKSSQHEAIANIWADALKQLGIATTIAIVDSAQETERKTAYDYDVMVNLWGMSLSPGNEQKLYWGAAGVTEPGTRNYMGMNSPAAEAMIEAMLTSKGPEDFTAAVQALDRVLTTGRYVVPFWFTDKSLIAHKSNLHFPQTLSPYGDWVGFMPDVWWSE